MDGLWLEVRDCAVLISECGWRDLEIPDRIVDGASKGWYRHMSREIYITGV